MSSASRRLLIRICRKYNKFPAKYPVISKHSTGQLRIAQLSAYSF